MKVPESAVLTGELLRFAIGLAALFVWAVWQDCSAWVLRRLGFIQVANEREAVANRTFKDIIGFDIDD